MDQQPTSAQAGSKPASTVTPTAKMDVSEYLRNRAVVRRSTPITSKANL
ncbi:MAG: hypothetical protein IPP67_03335 [Rhodospirillaceae bacterium]|nr:hypothetical protein [Rhodospirillaceae bacterium]